MFRTKKLPKIKLWNSRTCITPYLRYPLISNLIENILNKFDYFVGSSKIEKTINSLNRLVIFSFISSKNNKKLGIPTKLTHPLQGPIAIKNYQLQLIESLMVEYEKNLFSLDFRERLFKGSITSKMLSKSIICSRKSLALSIRNQVQDLSYFSKNKSWKSPNNFKKFLY